MPHRSMCGLAAALLALSLVVAACGDDEGAGGDANTLTLMLAADGLSGLPEQLDAGIYEITLTNDTDADAELDFIDNGGLPADDFLADLAPVIEGGPFPEYLDAVAGLGSVAAGTTRTTTITLGPSPYAAVDTGGEVPIVLAEFVVEGDAPDAGDLPAGATITATDYEFRVDGVEAGTTTVTFVNRSEQQVHHVIVLPFEEGVDPAVVEESIPTLLALPGDEPPPDDLPLPVDDEAFSSAVFSPGGGGTFDGTFEAGRTYGLFCFISDTGGGPPHAIAHDMFAVFTVPA